MKFVFLFSTKLRFFISEIPLIFLYVLAVMRNKYSTGVMKLYPLQLGLLFLILFIGVFFFRGIKITQSEIRDVGRFSPLFKAIINKDKTLILTLKNSGKLRVVLFGNDGIPPLYSSEEDATPMDIELFTGKTLGSRRTLKRILRFFGTDDADTERFVSGEFSKSYENTEVTSRCLEGAHEIRILFTKTV